MRFEARLLLHCVVVTPTGAEQKQKTISENLLRQLIRLGREVYVLENRARDSLATLQIENLWVGARVTKLKVCRLNPDMFRILPGAYKRLAEHDKHPTKSSASLRQVRRA